MTPSRPSVRALVAKVLCADSDLDAFCSDYFKDVYDRFTSGMDRVNKITQLLDRVSTSRIVAELRRAYPDAVQEYEALLEFIPLTATGAERPPTQDVGLTPVYCPSTIKQARAEYLEQLRSDIGARSVLAGLWPEVLLREVRVPVRQLSRPSDGEHRPLYEWVRATEGSARTVIVYGDVGCGKTELLSLTAADLARDAQVGIEQPMPLLVDARRLVAGSVEQAAKSRSPDAAEALGTLLQAPDTRWIVLVDGLDEVGIQAVDAIQKVVRRLGDRLHALVVATRPALRPSLPGATEIWLAPWTAQDLVDFFERWRSRDREAVAKLGACLHQAALAAFCTNPLTATLCLLAARDEPSALRSRAAVFTHIVERLFDQWATQRGDAAGARLAWKDVAPAVRKLALQTIRRERSSISRAELTMVLRREVPDTVPTARAALELHLGVLVSRSQDEYEFAIRGLAEHLAGQELLRQGDQAVVDEAFKPWAEETVRHAIGRAALEDPDRALGLLDALLLDEDKDNPGFRNERLRPVLVAIRAATDLGDIVTPIAGKLAGACVRRLADEKSVWIGDRVADATRELARAGGPCGTLLVKACVALASMPSEPAAWYAEQPWDGWAPWTELLFMRDPNVRRVAVDRLPAWVDNPVVRPLLFWEILDQGWEIGYRQPAIAAGLALRKAQRDEDFEERRQHLLDILAGRTQLHACAAAIALLPDEADPMLLAQALYHGASGFSFPGEIIEELARSDAGKHALDQTWPEWQKAAQASCLEPPMGPKSGEGRPAPSRQVRGRLLRAVAPGLDCAPAEVKKLFELGRFGAADALCAVASERPALILALLESMHELRLPPLSPAAEETLGLAALRRSMLRNKLIEQWDVHFSPRLPRTLGGPSPALYPGQALEPLVGRGDADAIRVYAEWLPRSRWMCMGYDDPPSLPPEVLVHEPIRQAALNIINDVWKQTTEGRLEDNGKRITLSPLTVGSIFHCVWHVWHEDPAWRAELDRWIQDDNHDRFLAAIHALEGVLILPKTTRNLIVEGLGKRMKDPEQHSGILLQVILPRFLRFIHRTRLASGVLPLLHFLVESGTSIACYAAMVSIPHVDHTEATRLSIAAANSPWIRGDVDRIDKPLFHWLVEAAPDAWAVALERMLETSPLPPTRLLLPFLDVLPAELKRRVVTTWAGAAGWNELPWSAEGGFHVEIARPADRARQLLFDAGLDHEIRPPLAP